MEKQKKRRYFQDDLQPFNSPDSTTPNGSSSFHFVSGVKM